LDFKQDNPVQLLAHVVAMSYNRIGSFFDLLFIFVTFFGICRFLLIEQSQKEEFMRAPRWAYVPLIIAFLTVVAGFYPTMQWSPGWGIFFIGGGLLGIGGITLISQHQFRKRAYYADGIIIAYKEEVSSDGDGVSRVWLPIVRYTLPNGQEITFQNLNSYSPKSLPVSTTVPVLYDPYDPRNAIINRSKEKIGVYLFVLFAIIFMGIGILILVGAIHPSMIPGDA